MQPFERLTSALLPLPATHVDTDQIIPASYLKIVDRSGLAEGLFAGWRYRQNGEPDPDFVLNKPQHRSARILLAGDNFGCGSSREHAPWALLAYGFRAVLSTRFADIFRSNALKNGLLVVTLPRPVIDDLFAKVETNADFEVTLDLEAQRLYGNGSEGHAFEIDPFSKHCLLEGVDPLGYLLEQIPHAEDWERRHPPRIDTRKRQAATQKT